MAKKQKHTKIVSNENMNPMTFSWEDVFYIQNLDDGTLWYRKNSGRQPDWYNLKLKPNPIYPDCRHYCIACGSDYNKMLSSISYHVSGFRTPDDMYKMLQGCRDQGKVGKVMLEYADEYWKEFGTAENIMMFNDDILEAIELGKKTRRYIGPNVDVRYTEEKDELFIKGRWAEWFENFIDCCMSFEGHTKVEFMEHIIEYIGDDKEVMNDVFQGLKKLGCKGIKQMKQLNMYRWIDALAPMVNDWYDNDDSSSGYDDYNGDEEYDEYE